jgi:LPS-assembly lipoprotein
MRFLLALIVAALLGGCGFHLRGSGSATLPYKTMAMALPDGSEVNLWLRRNVQATRTTQIVDDARDAEAVFQQLGDSRQKSILTVNTYGRVREYRLILTYAFQVTNAKGEILVPPTEIMLTRDQTYDDSRVLAKNAEEGLLWRDMEKDLVNQIMRRLAIVKPRDPASDAAD